MTSNTSPSYPAEYYYPEFIDSRSDDPRKSPSRFIPVTTSIDDGKGSSTKAPITTTTTKPISIQKKSLNRQQPPTNLSLDIVTDQGLPDTDITKAVITDPKKNLVRDPAERNIPKLIVDDSIIKQAVRTPKIVTTNLDDSNDPSKNAYHVPNGYTNGDLTHKTKFREVPTQQQQRHSIKFVEQEQPAIDDYWKQEVRINDDGIVTIEPLKYDRNTYEGPFGLTRQASICYYLILALITILAAIFLIMTGVFYSQGYPSASSKTGTLAGLCVCGLVFYLGLQLILIGLWHQKYRQENPKRIIGRTNKHNESSAHLKNSMEENESYGYSYQQQQQQPMDYTGYSEYSSAPYADYSNGGYVSNANEQMLLQQPGAATGAAYYDPVTWPSNVEVETQPDPKFLQPMDWTYGAQQPAMESPSTAIEYTTSIKDAPTNDSTPKKSNRRRHHHNKKTVQAEPPKPTFDSLVPSSTVVEAPLPVLAKAPETNELLRTIAETDKNDKHNHRSKHSNQDNSSQDSHHRRHRRHSRHRSHSRHRHHSCSTCSSCSSCSRNDYYSDFGANHHHHFEPPLRIITPRPYNKTRSPSPPRKYTHTYYDNDHRAKKTKDSSIGTGLEDVPNVRDDRLEQLPVVRRTIIVEPYPAEPTSQVFVEKARTQQNTKSADDVKTNISPRKSKSKNKTNDDIEDVRLDDVRQQGPKRVKSKSKTNGKSTPKKNAFYD